MYVNGNRRGDWTFLNIKDGLGVWINWDVDLDAAKYGRNKIHYLSSTELIMGTDVIHHCFVSVSGNSGNGNSDGEAPNFVDFSYSSTSSSVTVIFHTDTDINGGTVYYGKNSPTTAVSSTNTTIGKHMVQATIKNLSKSTKYYVKCTVKNSYGTTTSDVLPVMTGQ